ncbi:hypothetical protein GCM10027590_42290 [Nocardiopsis nanhaiensis]
MDSPQGFLKDDQVVGKHGLCVVGSRGKRFSEQGDGNGLQTEPKSHGDSMISVERAELLVEPEAKRCQDPVFSDVGCQCIQVTWCVDKRGTDTLTVDSSVSRHKRG